MKRILLLASALLALTSLNGQTPGYSPTGIYDDFEGATDYSMGANLQGVYWWENTGGTAIVKSRAGSTGSGYLNLAITNAGGCNSQNSTCYPVLGFDFGTDGSSNKYSINLTNNANIILTIENTNQTQDFFATIELEDINGKKSMIEPNIADVTNTVTWGTAGNPRKARNGFTLPAAQGNANDKKTITIDLSSVPGAVGGLPQYYVAPATHGFSCSTPYDCPSTSYAGFDITQIVGVIITLNYGKDNLFISEGDGDPLADTFIDGSTIAAFTGTVKIHEFKIGTITAGTTDALLENTLSLFPNPATDALNVAFESTTSSVVTLTDMLGNTVYSSNASNGTNKLSINTTEFTSGLYVLNITSEKGSVSKKVTIN